MQRATFVQADHHPLWLLPGRKLQKVGKSQRQAKSAPTLLKQAVPVVETWQSAVTTSPELYVVDEDHAAALQLLLLEPHTLAVPPPPHVAGAVQVPHELTVRVVPQLSAAVTAPQFLPRREQNCAFVSAVHPGGPKSWISASCRRVVAPLFAVIRKRYCWNAVVLFTV